jgi:hypothetical protein
MILSAFRRFVPIGVAIAWAAAVAAGFGTLQRYSSTPGSVGETTHRWPSESRIAFDPGHSNLVMLVHPHCPCSKASLFELQHVMTRCHGLVTAHVLFLNPEKLREPWGRTYLWDMADAIPGTQALADNAGREAARFGAKTSGHVLLYDPSGTLVFSGGITGARGHEGDNPGREAVIALASTHASRSATTPVFGCPLSE